MFWGIFLIIIGLAFLLENLGFIPANSWDFIWPSLLILLGVTMLVRRGKFSHWCCCYPHKHDATEEKD